MRREKPFIEGMDIESDKIEIQGIGQIDKRLAALAWENFLKRLGNNSPENEERAVLWQDLERLAEQQEQQKNKNFVLLGDVNIGCAELINYLKNDFDAVEANLVATKIIKAPNPQEQARSALDERRRALNKFKQETEKIYLGRNGVYELMVEIGNAITDLKIRTKKVFGGENLAAWENRIAEKEKKAEELRGSISQFEQYFDDQKREYETRLQSDKDLKQTQIFCESWLEANKKTLNEFGERAEKLADDLTAFQNLLQLILKKRETSDKKDEGI